MRLFLTICILASLQVAFAETKTNQAPQLTVGTTYFYPPFEEQTDNKGNFEGLDIDVMNEICKRLKVSCTYKAMDFIELMPAIENKEINLAIAAVSITDKRKQSFLFSTPYLINRIQYITLKNSNFNQRDQLDSLTVGVFAGTIDEVLIQEKTRHNLKYVTFHHIEDMIQALRDGKIQAILTDTYSAKYWVATIGNEFKLVGMPIDSGTGYAIITDKANQALIDKVNKALKDMQEDGALKTIFSKYF